MVEDSLESMTLQLAMGFGQGAGTMLATTDAVMMARDAYRVQLGQIAGQWSEYALQTIEYSRVLGSLAAAHALNAGRSVIESYRRRRRLAR